MNFIMVRKFSFFLLIFVILQFKRVYCSESITCKQQNIQQEERYFHRIIKLRETLYPISKKYKIRGEKILDFNPKLSINTSLVGNIIPILIDKITPIKSDTNKLSEKRMLNVVLLLPFGVKDGTFKDIVGRCALEYYEGLLIALKHIKEIGISVSLKVFDVGLGVELLQNIFDNALIKNTDLVIGGLTGEQIELISAFSDKYGVPYVIPFHFNGDSLLFSDNTYQVSIPKLYLYDKISTIFCNEYNDANIVFYIPNSFGNKIDFIYAIQKKLLTKKITYKVITDENPSYSDIIALLDNSKKNIFVLFDDRCHFLSKIISLLKKIKDTNHSLFISLFGYPIWQNYWIEYADYFFHLNITFYSIFYANPILHEVQSFCDNYKYWYSKKMMDHYPKYGMLGYDTAMFFIQLLNKYGASLAENLDKFKYSGIQNRFHFEKINDRCGFVNTGFFLIKFDEDYVISFDFVE
ncbi:MAG: hypothetical protein LBC54_00660 [Bacteroidales bacterium OttesenSCG-928-I14]|jgi:hypothetical protein|nr:hypothetical protein [Bacteroidales bacterium OttesenSCG-928-I14]